MSKRTDKIYCVTVVKYANMADSPQEAMEIAKKYTDEYITDEDFEDSEVDVYQSDSYASNADWFDEAKYIFTKDGAVSYDQYVEELEAQEE